ncbi:Uma2 family endonuclease [Streptomyces sp. NRRL B-1677]|uniref:Uma2 family endonuclease n=1 Tax=Streptomyces sp. NRRL B-1677 TaxID=2682966 RepID=UPI001892A7FE|nr:Uma2 family endonuclease [Streptomyces sp. NRRL B-1677]MBF6045511.1 Uma2 family endonuclease [Streptomyces sp. NRRL B-1677]
MSAQPHPYAADDPETALKYAIQHLEGDRVQIVEGVITLMSPSWDHESLGDSIRRQIDPVVRRLGCISGAGDLDLPGTPNWYVPDVAVVPKELTKGAGALLPDQTLLIVEVTSDSNGDTDRIVKRRRYAEFGAPLYLLVDRQDHTCTLFSQPGEIGYQQVDGPHSFGKPLRLPDPFNFDLDTSEFRS